MHNNGMMTQYNLEYSEAFTKEKQKNLIAEQQVPDT
jgi:hypothetical protein